MVYIKGVSFVLEATNFVKEQNILISVNIASIYEFSLSLSFNLKIRRERDLKYFES